ncbi:hypothetical protein C0991_002247, partial [Blastosporella zonata]
GRDSADWTRGCCWGFIETGEWAGVGGEANCAPSIHGHHTRAFEGCNNPSGGSGYQWDTARRSEGCKAQVVLQTYHIL